MIECLLHPPMIFMLTGLSVGFGAMFLFGVFKRDKITMVISSGGFLYGLLCAFILGAMMVPYFPC